MAPDKPTLLLRQSKLSIFGDWFDNDTRTIMSILKIGDIPHNFMLIDMLSGQHHSEKFLSVNPLGSLPIVLENNFFVMGTTAVFLKYFANSKPKVAEHYPADR